MFVRLLIVALFLSIIPLFTSAKVLEWEVINGSQAVVTDEFENNALTIIPESESGIAIGSNNGYIYIKTDHEMNVSVYSILGQKIGEGDIQPGTYRMPMSAKGIYIIRAGLATLRVTI